MLLSGIISFQINIAIAKSIKIPWLKITNSDEVVPYEVENTRPIALYKLASDEVNSVFFIKNNAICVNKYNIFNGIVVPLYNYMDNEYNLLKIDSSQIEAIYSANEYVKTPNGDVCLLYTRSIPEHGILKEGICNLSKRKIIYEKEDILAWFTSYPLFNSVTVILGDNYQRNTIYIDIVNLLNGDKNRISCPAESYLKILVGEYLDELLNLVKNKRHKQYIKKLLKQLLIESPSIEVRFITSKIDKHYTLGLTSDKLVFCKSFAISTYIRHIIEDEELSLEIHNSPIIHCSIEKNELVITLETGNLCRLLMKSTDVEINIPSQIILSQTYRIEMPINLEKSHLYAVSDFFDDYVIIEDEIWKLQLSTDGRYYHSIGHGTLTNVLRFDNITIYQISDDNRTRLLARAITDPFEKGRKLSPCAVYNSSYEVHVLELHNALTRKQYNRQGKIQKHIDVTEYVINIDARPIVDNSQEIIHRLFKGSEGRFHKHKIYFDNKNGNVYLFLSIFTLDLASGLYIVYIPVYKFSIKNPKNGYVHILTLGPYRYRTRIILPNKLLPTITKDIAIAGYNMLLYPDLLADLVSDFLPILDEKTVKTNNIFIYNSEIKFRFGDHSVDIVDAVYNRRIVFAYDVQPKSAISNCKQDDKVILCLDLHGIEIVYKPFILSEMELVKPMSYYA